MNASCPCPDYKEPVCPRTTRVPFVCNGCPDKGKCRLTRYFYSASLAHRDYLYMLSDSRSGILLPTETACSIEEVITPLIVEKGQSINQVYINHPDLLPFSKPTFYKYVNEGIFGVRSLDLPRKVKYKQRKSSSPRTPVNTLVRQNRTYKDYHEYIRYLLPKGTSFAGMTYDKCTLLASHINSIPRLSLNSRTPYDIASILIGEDNFKRLGRQQIKADDVCLNPKLLKPQK